MKMFPPSLPLPLYQYHHPAYSIWPPIFWFGANL